MPKPVEDGLRTFFTYQNRLTGARVERLSVLKSETVSFFLHNNPPGDWVAGIRPVYILKASRVVDTLNCQSDTSWVNCAANWFKAHGNALERSQVLERGNESLCEYSLEVPQWAPSPESEQKQKVAAELLQELKDHFASLKFRSVYVRDFNLKDRGIDFYYQLESGEEGTQGCGFDVDEKPHCVDWHLYGNVTLASVRQMIMEKPVRLFPSQVGEP